MHMRMHVCMHVRVHVCMHVCVLHVCVCMHACMRFVWMHTCLRERERARAGAPGRMRLAKDSAYLCARSSVLTKLYSGLKMFREEATHVCVSCNPCLQQRSGRMMRRACAVRKCVYVKCVRVRA